MKFAVFVLFVALFFSSHVLAQSAVADPSLLRGLGQAGPGGGLATSLLRMSDVQHELQLDAQQQNSLAQQLAKSSRQRRNFFRNLVEGRVFEKELSLEETRQVFDLYNGYHDELLLKLLSSQQSERLWQIRCQLQGPAALTHSDVAQKIGLTAEQQQQINKLLVTANASRSGVASVTSPLEEVLSVLTAEQQLRWREVQGETFDFVELRKRAIPMLAPTPTQLVSRQN